MATEKADEGRSGLGSKSAAEVEEIHLNNGYPECPCCCVLRNASRDGIFE